MDREPPAYVPDFVNNCLWELDWDGGSYHPMLPMVVNVALDQNGEVQDGPDDWSVIFEWLEVERVVFGG